MPCTYLHENVRTELSIAQNILWHVSKVIAWLDDTQWMKEVK